MMKKIVALFIILIGLFSITQAKEITYKDYGNMYLDVYTGFYNNKIEIGKDTIRIWTPNHKEVWKVIEEKLPYKKSEIYGIALGDNEGYSTYLFILKNKKDIDHIFEKYDYNEKTLLDKPYIQISYTDLYTGTNYIYTCKGLSINKNSMGRGQTPMVIMVCSAPSMVYKLQNKIYLNEDEYNKAYKNYSQNQNQLKQSKISFIDKLIKYKTDNTYDYNYFYNLVNKIYGISNINSISELQNLYKQVYVNGYNKIYRYKLPNGLIVFQILDKDQLMYIISNVIEDRINYLKNKQKQLIQEQEKYKENALKNYGSLLQKYNQLKQEYENYKRLTAENRQKAIKLTILLTKILSRYHDKQTKLRLLDQIDEIIATKYSPDKFKNQDLIGYVKDYLKIIRLAIQLSQ